MVDLYLHNRTLLYNTLEGKDGFLSCPEPISNQSYDSTSGMYTMTVCQRAEMPDETHLVGYADDVAALYSARTIEQDLFNLNMVMHRGNKPIAKYLGVMIGAKMNFGKQIQHTAVKTTRGLALLGILMVNVGGPSFSRC